MPGPARRPPKQAARPRQQITAIRRTLAAEKRKFGGYDGSRGWGYLPSRSYGQLADFAGGPTCLRWCWRSFPTDVGFADFLFEATILLFKQGKLAEASRQATATYRADRQLLARFLGAPAPPAEAWETLLFTCTQQQAEQQCAHTYHSSNSRSQVNLELFRAGQLPQLACVAQLAEGINIPGLRVGIIWHVFGNERRTAQRIGRLLRLNPDEVATVHLLVYQDTVDEYWLQQALDAFDPDKISYVDATGFVPASTPA